MNESLLHRTTCRLCDGGNRKLIVSLEPTPPGDHYVAAARLGDAQPVYPLDLMWCADCHHFELSNAVDPEILYGNYIYNTAISLGLPEHFQRYADAVLDRVAPPAGSLVIDIGSNDGTLLKAFQARGMQVLGIDPARAVAAKAIAAGVHTLTTFFTASIADDIRMRHGAVHIVTANNVFANIDDLGDFARGVRTLLAPDGVFVFETGYMVDFVEQTILDNVYHEHLCYYAVRPLAAFFRRHGMELIDIDRVDTKGGSLRGIVQLAGGPRPAAPSVRRWIDDELTRGFDTIAPFTAFGDRVAAVKSELRQMLGDLRAAGKTIAGYGASVGVTTLLHHFDFSRMLSFIVDDNPVRHGLFTPGHHLPVLRSETLYDRKPDYVVVLAWRYFEPIRKRHLAYEAQGGRFILPLPTVRTV